MDQSPIETAKRLAADLELVAVRIDHLKEDIKRRIETLTPLDGWPGKNAEQRDAAQAARINSDDDIAALRTDLRTAELKLAAAKAGMATFEIERREREWNTRRDYIAAMAANGATATVMPF